MRFLADPVSITGRFGHKLFRGLFIEDDEGMIWRVTVPWKARPLIGRRVHAVGIRYGRDRIDIIDIAAEGETPNPPPLRRTSLLFESD